MRLLVAGIASVLLVASVAADDIQPGSAGQTVSPVPAPGQELTTGAGEPDTPEAVIEQYETLPDNAQPPEVPAGADDAAHVPADVSADPAAGEALPADAAVSGEPQPPVVQDPTQQFPEPPPPPGAEEQQTGPLRAMVRQLTNATRTVCAGRDDCARMAGSFAMFLWNNRDSVDIQTRAVRCLGQSAVRRGYVQSPMDAFRNASTAEMMEISVEVCECVVGLGAKLNVCRPSLLKGNIAPLMGLIDRSPAPKP